LGPGLPPTGRMSSNTGKTWGAYSPKGVIKSDWE
jgi:hypothetical protein